ANATAFCIAAERISGIVVPDRAWYLRTILLEMERIISHLGDQAGMLTDIAFPFGASRFAVLREEMMRMNARITGSRFLRGIMKVGGLERDISFEDLNILADFCDLFRGRYRALLRIALTTTSVIDRFTPTGIVSRDLIVPLALSGPTARASGSMNDTRVQHPYGIYDRYIPEVKTLHEGDVLARFTLKAEEIIASLDIIDRLIREMPEGPVSVNAPVADGYSLALVESARGQNMCWLWIRDGKIWRYKVRTASFCNWQAIEHAVQNEILPDFPLINKSFNFSYAGTDL
ncbi:MAG: hydrogenase large subunit, partial [Methanomicrobiales archaeon]|nr:hydrogenase large subunit [Methanomicrobiales archaeon]